MEHPMTIDVPGTLQPVFCKACATVVTKESTAFCMNRECTCLQNVWEEISIQKRERVAASLHDKLFHGVRSERTICKTCKGKDQHETHRGLVKNHKVWYNSQDLPNTHAKPKCCRAKMKNEFWWLRFSKVCAEDKTKRNK